MMEERVQASEMHAEDESKASYAVAATASFAPSGEAHEMRLKAQREAERDAKNKATTAAAATIAVDIEKMRLDAQREAEREAEINETAAAPAAAVEAEKMRLKAESEADEQRKQRRRNRIFRAFSLSDSDDEA